MKKILPFKAEYSTNHYYVIKFTDPENNKTVNYVLYSYIDDIGVIASIVAHSTKYSFEIEYKGTEDPSKSIETMSINQAVSFFRRLRFIRKVTVKRQRVVEWNEIIEEEL